MNGESSSFIIALSRVGVSLSIKRCAELFSSFEKSSIYLSNCTSLTCSSVFFIELYFLASSVLHRSVVVISGSRLFFTTSATVLQLADFLSIHESSLFSASFMRGLSMSISANSPLFSLMK